jgi:acetoacetate decarboxylase
MTLEDVRKAAFAMPLTSPSYPVGPYRFSDREYMIISYRTNREALERIVPEPLEFIEGVVQYEVIGRRTARALAPTQDPTRSFPFAFAARWADI